MKQSVLAEAMLKSYSNLVVLAEAIDKKIMNFTTIQCVKDLSALELSNKIIDMMQKKILMCNTKVLVERVFKQLDKDLARLLILHYVDNMTIEKLASHFNISLRTAYRKFARAKEDFVNLLTLNGYGEKRLNEMYKGQYWLLKYIDLDDCIIRTTDKKDELIVNYNVQ